MPDDLTSPGQGRDHDDAWKQMIVTCLAVWLLVLIYAIGAAIWMACHA